MLALLKRIRDIENDIIVLTAFLFNILALAVFCYFLRRKYLLVIEIKNVLKHNIMMSPCYQNHLKNLQIKSMITNFVIIIVFVEFMFNLSTIGRSLPCWWDTFHENNFSVFPNLNRTSYPFFRQIENVTLLCHIVIPCLLLKVLLLTYLHCSYRYTVMRWSVYIIVRIVIFTFILFSIKKIYEDEFISLQDILRSLTFLIDFVTYIIYSRRFYLHLKSREKEARLFKDRTTYLNERSLCLHFKVASILVTIALFALLFFPMIYPMIAVPDLYIMHFDQKVHDIMELTIAAVVNIGYIIYSIIFILNYLYVTFIIVGKYLIQKRGLVHVNKKIKPMIASYHESPYFAKCFDP